MEWYLAVLKNYVGFSGRARRKEFWMFVLFNAIITFVLSIVGEILHTEILSAIYALVMFLPSLAVQVRRLHDVNKSGAMLVIPVIFSIIIVIILTAVMVSALGAVVTGSMGGFGVYAILFFALCLADIIFSIVLLVWFCKEGDRGANKYGEDPKAAE